MKQSYFVMTTFTPHGVFKKNLKFKTKNGMRKSKERQNLSYGAHLGSEAFEVSADGTKTPVLVFA